MQNLQNVNPRFKNQGWKKGDKAFERILQELQYKLRRDMSDLQKKRTLAEQQIHFTLEPLGTDIITMKS